MLSRRPARIPKYVLVAEEFRQQVKNGVLKPGDRLPSFIEMREQRGIGQGILERVHALLEQDGLIVREPGRGTFVKQPRLRERTGIIGFSGPGFTLTSTFSYWARVVEGMREATRRAGLQIMLLDADSPGGWDKVDGIVMSEWRPELAMRWADEGLPLVSVIVPVEGVPSVVADDYQGVRDATRHLLSLGHRRIACLTMSGSPVTDRRLAGYEAGLREAGIQPNPQWVRRLRQPERYNEMLTSFGREAMAAWLSEDWHQHNCSALIAHNDETAFGVMEVLKEAGLSVPQAVSVVGFDGIEMGDYMTPRLTSMEVPLRDIGSAAVNLLLRQIEAPSVKVDNLVLPVTIKPGDSVASWPTPVEN